MSLKETSAENKRILRSLLALPENKTCADCKTATHPRWASWNLGIFLCIRCSGVHRSLGTHISKVRSVDLDSWTDSHLYEMQRWGNKRANLYWEARLPADYKPDESKIVNYIKTKYDLKRWIAGPLPSDPKALEDGNYSASTQSDNIPLAQVRSNLVSRNAPAAPLPPRVRQPVAKPQPVPDLFGDFVDARAHAPMPTTRPAAASIAVSRSTAHAQPRPIPDLLNFDSVTPAPKPAQPVQPAITTKTAAPAARPAATSPARPPVAAPAPVARPSVPTSTAAATQPPKSAAPVPAAAPDASRIDLKQSILSLYANKTSPAVPTPTSASKAAPVSRPGTSLDSLFETSSKKPTSGGSSLLTDFDPWAKPAAPSAPTAPAATFAPAPQNTTSTFDFTSQPGKSTPLAFDSFTNSFSSVSLQPTVTSPPAAKSTYPLAAPTSSSQFTPAATSTGQDFGPAPSFMLDDDDAFANVWS